MPELGGERWMVDDLTVDVGSQSVTRDGATIALPQLSFKFLLTLIRASPDVLSVNALMEQVWSGVFVNAETVTQRAKLLRDALGDNPKAPRYFTVRRRSGYQLIPVPVRLGGGKPDTALTPTKRWKTVLVALALGLLAAGGLTLAVWPDATETGANASVRVAVLPFDNLSGDPSDAFIARSIPEMVLNRLSSVKGLTVIARDSALLSSASILPAYAVGKQLNVDYVVKGSVQRVGDTVRVTCFLLDAGRGARLWSERFDWPINRLYALQDRIADRVAASLETKVRGLGSLPEVAGVSENPDAYLAYLKGKSLLSRFTVAETDAAAIQFERAVRLDPDFSDALIALFDARMQGADLRKDDLASYRARYQPLLNKALERNPDSGSGLFAKAMWSDIPAAEREQLFRHAAELDPSNSRGLTAYAQFLDRSAALQGARAGETKPEDAKRLVDRVLAIDPLSPRTRWWAVQRGFSILTPEQIERSLARELEMDPQNYVVGERYAFRRWMFHGETAEAIAKMERIIASDPQNPSGPHFAVAFYLDANDTSAAHALAATTPASRDASRVLFAQYAGDWRKAGAAAYDRRGHLFNEFQNWNWAEAIRDYALHTREYDRGAETIASRYEFDLKRPRVMSVAQVIAAPPLGHILLAKGDVAAATRLLAETVQWIDTHPRYGLAGIARYRAAAMMLLGDRNQALTNLRASIETGHDIRFWWYVIDRDPVWAPVRGDPRFKAIAEMCRQAASVQRAKLDALRRAGKVPVRQPAGRI